MSRGLSCDRVFVRANLWFLTPVVACLSESTWSRTSQFVKNKGLARSLSEAGEENADEIENQETTHHDVAEQEEFEHELSGLDLVVVVRAVVVLHEFKLSFVKRITGGVLARGVESQDVTGDHPGESTEATRDTLETTAEVSELQVNATSDAEENETNPGEHHPDETQSEPENELAMDIGQGAVGVLDS